MGWGRSDKASRERMRKLNKRKADEKEARFERNALQEDHPQVCPVCMDNEKTHLLVDCGETQRPWHRYHGLCQDCAQHALQVGECPLCRGQVTAILPVETSFFVGI